MTKYTYLPCINNTEFIHNVLAIPLEEIHSEIRCRLGQLAILNESMVLLDHTLNAEDVKLIQGTESLMAVHVMLTGLCKATTPEYRCQYRYAD